MNHEHDSCEVCNGRWRASVCQYCADLLPLQVLTGVSRTDRHFIEVEYFHYDIDKNCYPCLASEILEEERVAEINTAHSYDIKSNYPRIYNTYW